MPMTVITVTNAPPSLRGDLTKWMQEIATGVYIGNFNSRIREQLWERVTQSVGRGQATISYTYRNESGYQFQTYQTQRQNVNYDGIPLVLIPRDEKESMPKLTNGFSNASNFRKAKKYSAISSTQTKTRRDFVVVDIETDGLSESANQIIEIGAVKVEGDHYVTMNTLIEYKGDLPAEIVSLTGITTSMLHAGGIPISDALNSLSQFVGSLPIVGYSVDFDIRFINQQLKKLDMPLLTNKTYDLLRFVKKEKMFLENYRLETALLEYEIDKKVPHRALEDAKLTYELAMKVNGFLKMLDRK